MSIQGPNTYGSYINEAFKDPRYTAAEKAVSDAQAALDALVTSAPNFQTEEQKRILAADKFLPTFNANRQQQVADLYARPATARQENQNIFDPTRRSALVAQAVGNVLGQLSGTNESIAQRKGTATDLATQAYNSLLSRIEGQRSSLDTAKEKRNTIKSLLEDAAKSFYEEQQYEKRRQQALADDLLKINRSKTSGDEGLDMEAVAQFASDMEAAANNIGEAFDPVDYAERAIPQAYRSAAIGLFYNRPTPQPDPTPATAPPNTNDPVNSVIRQSIDRPNAGRASRITEIEREMAGLPVMSSRRVALQAELNKLRKSTISGS